MQQRKTLLLFGKNAPAIFTELSKNKTAEAHLHFEKDEHKSAWSTPHFLDIKNGETGCLIVCVEPESISATQRKGYGEKFQITLKQTDVVVLCPDSIKDKSGLVAKTQSDFELFKKNYDLPVAETVVATPSFHLKDANEKNPITFFLENCEHHPRNLLRSHASHFGIGTKEALVSPATTQTTEHGLTPSSRG